MSDMKLTSLNPQFICYELRIEPGRRVKAGVDPLNYTPEAIEDYIGQHKYFVDVGALADAQGISFDCPKCTKKNGGPVGTHKLVCFFPDRGVPEDVGLNLEGRPVRWSVKGADFADLTLHPSINITRGCGWHGFITAGEATNA